MISNIIKKVDLYKHQHDQIKEDIYDLSFFSKDLLETCWNMHQGRNN